MYFGWRNAVLFRNQPLSPQNILMAKPNYSFEKRKRDMEKKAKKEEKRKRKAENAANPSANTEESTTETAPADQAGTA